MIISEDFANEIMDASMALIDPCIIRVYNGTQPASPSVAITTQVMLAEFFLPSPAFAAAVAGVSVANAIEDATAAATGTATWFRLFKADETATIDGTVGTAAADLIISSTGITAGDTVEVISLQIELPR